ncbi:MAG TPA: Na+/H+ antiporter [Nocardioidaceae bacterium]|nr:Na+/H+ antiporter [Nocardioidaceae bacterium]
MHVALSLVALLAVVVVVSGLCRRFDLSAPLVLIALGMVGSTLPFLGEVRLSSEIVLVGLLPPLLYAAALQTSLVDFNANRSPILLLSVGLVAFTTVGVGVVVHGVLPGVSWPAAFAIGAVVAPPDAVAATAIARRIGLPRRIVTVLEGESLLNDATALVALRTAIAGSVGVVAVGLDFAWAAGGGVLVGLLLFVVVGWGRKHVTDPVLDTSVSLLTPFAAYVLAEEVHASGVLAVVVSGLALGHKAPVLQTASSRIAERLNWRTISFLLENTVFLLIGLQASWILAEVGASELSVGRIALVCLAAFAATVLLRPVWIFAFRFLLLAPSRGEVRPVPSWKTSLLVSWAGMRGVVTLAAAFAIPEDVQHREVLLLVAFTVTAGTLFGQGLTLPWLARRLEVPGPDPRQDALARATLFQDASAAGLAVLEEHAQDEDPYDTVDALRRRVEQRDFTAWERLGRIDPAVEAPSEAYARLRLEMLQAERERVLEVRSTGRVPHEVVEDVLAALDVEESMLDASTARRERLRDDLAEDMVTVTQHDRCDHLETARMRPVPDHAVCEDCVAEGSTWVHLRLCLTCGEVRCCDSSPRRHASAHASASGHPVVRSAEPNETWRWCYVDSIVG